MSARAVVAALAAALVALPPAIAAANECRVLQADFIPAESPNPDPGLRRPVQIVAWLEDADGNFIDTAFITEQIGTYGLGNRPGRFDFNSAPGWPYGRRTTVFPVWAHRKNQEFFEVAFQDGDENNLSHAFEESSPEKHYCAPIPRTAPAWDAGTCASQAYSDKGMFSSRTSLYPPRQDIARQPGNDSASVTMYALLNPFDTVSQATPPSGSPAAFSWPAPFDLPPGNYILWVEVAREFDQNDTYSAAAYPGPAVGFSEFGEPYRGQPSVVYKVPIVIDATDTQGTTADYAGYSDPDGLDGNLRAPDATITIDTPGSGAQRFAIVPGGGYRVRVNARHVRDDDIPDAPGEIAADPTSKSATLSFVAPGDDGHIGKVKGYEVRYLIAADVTEENFALAILSRPLFEVVASGATQTIELDKLLPETTYSFGFRAFDECGNFSAVTTVRFTTDARLPGEVDACFVATAAYGSVLANDVEMLRRFRDLVLQKSVLGELFVETYYTFGPAVAGVIGESEILRETARAVLAPIVATIRAFAF